MTATRLTPARERVLRLLLRIYHECERPWLDVDAWGDLCCRLYARPWPAWSAFLRLVTGMERDGLLTLHWDAEGNADVDLTPAALRALMEVTP